MKPRAARLRPAAAIVNTQPVKATEKGGADGIPLGYDAGKKVKGIKRNAVVDTIGLLLGVEAIPASAQDRDGAAELIKKTRRLFPFVRHVFADGGHSGDRLATGLSDHLFPSDGKQPPNTEGERYRADGAIFFRKTTSHEKATQAILVE